jgi:hypothetical protein
MSDKNNSRDRRRCGPKQHLCPSCHEAAILLVDIEDEMLAETDDAGNIQYLCPKCNKIFSVANPGNAVCK